MDIRYRCREIAEHAPIEQKIRFCQARYDEKRMRQIYCFAEICAGRRAMSGSSKHKRQTRIFADYRNRKVFDSAAISQELQHYDVISFDVFDTLICRTVGHPTDVFGIMEQRTGIPEFANCRIEAENAARQYRSARYHTREVTIEEIYHTMLQDSRVKVSSGKYGAALTKQDLSTWIALEMEAEKQCCRADPYMRKLVRLLLAQGKPVIATSDMYLHQAQVQDLLQLCGYADFGEIYVSCDHRAGKSDGRLFPRILQRLGPDKRLVHIGDNFYADVYKPKELGMSTIHYITERRGSQNEDIYHRGCRIFRKPLGRLHACRRA